MDPLVEEYLTVRREYDLKSIEVSQLSRQLEARKVELKALDQKATEIRKTLLPDVPEPLQVNLNGNLGLHYKQGQRR